MFSKWTTLEDDYDMPSFGEYVHTPVKKDQVALRTVIVNTYPVPSVALRDGQRLLTTGRHVGCSETFTCFAWVRHPDYRGHRGPASIMMISKIHKTPLRARFIHCGEYTI